MNVDRYTKIVLTVIAFALLANVVQNNLKDANAAESAVQKIAICNQLGTFCVDPSILLKLR